VAANAPPETDAITVAPAFVPRAASEHSHPTFVSGQQPVTGDASNVDFGTGGVDFDISSTMLDDFPVTFEWDWNESLNLDPSFYLTDTNVMYVDSLTLNGLPQVISSANQPLATPATMPIAQRESESPARLLGCKSTFFQICRLETHKTNMQSWQRRLSRQSRQQPRSAYSKCTSATNFFSQSLHTHIHHKALAARPNHPSANV
jgi:hypothetical protein